jgi:hypothetical protein
MCLSPLRNNCIADASPRSRSAIRRRFPLSIGIDPSSECMTVAQQPALWICGDFPVFPGSSVFVPDYERSLSRFDAREFVDQFIDLKDYFFRLRKKFPVYSRFHGKF